MPAKFKYPRTYHLPWSPGSTNDDKKLGHIKHFEGKLVVVTEKLDGECTTLYHGGSMHARSLDGVSHSSQSYVRSLGSRIGQDIPEGWRVCGENCYALHSCAYSNLDDFFLVFGIYDENNVCLSWEDTVEWAELLGLKTVPILYEGIWDEDNVKDCMSYFSKQGGDQEGYVVRFASSFKYKAFAKCVAKYVRKNHVQAGAAHWKSAKIIPNQRKYR